MSCNVNNLPLGCRFSPIAFGIVDLNSWDLIVQDLLVFLGIVCLREDYRWLKIFSRILFGDLFPSKTIWRNFSWNMGREKFRWTKMSEGIEGSFPIFPSRQLFLGMLDTGLYYWMIQWHRKMGVRYQITNNYMGIKSSGYSQTDMSFAQRTREFD